ncbi:bile acid:sodium symporter family protein [Brevibacillus laterosporus]|uniref:bile acid:sodium symporter family protein n=1 Tax=Brevibacillus laterosporus TaxID=1465 RepID=UPI000B9B879E|nr:bile acid:sodium symporter family protein [Brevibacillus laterosporus]MBG9790282.1 sodium transporter [Brevibacillus laterosporus]MCG7317451.1 bile acid:sodium symporter family protein [Brevibacillus laterosporus]MED1665430.1 bile acid:sodium symporter family protein [Brevibacillus laterosporus]MED1671051.1 bile acid:sodium symporter family protein [Brevibacillus laterosporus]MED1720426.1 bile acid:sodium symporter family protein [Brevibacillus laterosporus]
MGFVERISSFAGKTFTVWVLLFSVIAYVYPEHFTWIGAYVIPLLGIVMFGMGLTISASDFKEVFRRPKDVALGVIGHYLVMPLLAFLLAYFLELPPEIAVGVILVGCCPSGTASNVMVFLSRGDVALAVAIASVSTLLAPVVTPFLILLLASKWVDINIWSLFYSIIQVVIIPLALGLFVKKYFGKQAAASVKALPLVSVVAIVMIICGVVAGNQAKLASAGLIIFAVVVLHNVLGFLLGFLFARLCGMDLAKQKAVAMEVGMQNSGLGVAIATAHFSPLAAVPSAIFSVWHNISGSVLASIFSRMKEKNEVNMDEMT